MDTEPHLQQKEAERRANIGLRAGLGVLAVEAVIIGSDSMNIGLFADIDTSAGSHLPLLLAGGALVASSLLVRRDLSRNAP